jgi:hypothetical protein
VEPEDFTSLMDDLKAKVFAAYDDDTVLRQGTTSTRRRRPSGPTCRSGASAAGDPGPEGVDGV